jgi:hypothetical protein
MKKECRTEQRTEDTQPYPPQLGGEISSLPSGYGTIVVNNVTVEYYGGTYYQRAGSGFIVVAPPGGAVVRNLPQGAEKVKIGSQTYVKVGETYYQPVQTNGRNTYEVSQVEGGFNLG